MNTLVRINSTNLPKLKSYEPNYVKLWADGGRNMAGELNATFIGNFIKITLEFAYTTRAEMTILTNLFLNSTFSVDWYDVASNSLKTQDFYAGDFKIPLFRKDTEVYAPFSVNIISFKKIP